MQDLSRALRGLLTSHPVLAAAAGILFVLGGLLGWCRGFTYGWPGAAIKAVSSLGSYDVRSYSDNIYQKGDEFIFRYSLHTSGGCPFEQTREAIWFTIDEETLFAGNVPLNPENFRRTRETALPWESGFKIIRGFEPGPGGFPPDLREKYDFCIVATRPQSGERGVRLVSDCTGTRKEAVVPVLLSADHEYRSWWWYPMLPLLVPAAILFDVVTIPLNVPVIVLLILAIAANRPSRHPFAVSALVLAGSYIATFLLAALIPHRGTTGSGGLGGLAAIGPLMIMALATSIIPIAVSVALAVVTKRRWLVFIGVVTGILSVIGTFFIFYRFEGAYNSLPRLLALQLSPSIIVPGAFAVALACWAAHLARGTSGMPKESRT